MTEVIDYGWLKNFLKDCFHPSFNYKQTRDYIHDQHPTVSFWLTERLCHHNPYFHRLLIVIMTCQSLNYNMACENKSSIPYHDIMNGWNLLKVNGQTWYISINKTNKTKVICTFSKLNIQCNLFFMYTWFKSWK